MPKKPIDKLDNYFFRASEELQESKKAERALKKVRRKAEKQKGEFKLTKPQQKFLDELQKKYGGNLVKEIKNFRNNIVAPLHFVHKKTKEGGMVTTKDLVGLTKKEWERAVESGKSKIKRRSEVKDRIKKDISAIDYNKRSIEKLEKIKRMLSGKSKFDPNMVRAEIDRFIKNYNFLSGAKVDSLKQVQQYTSDIEKSWNNIKKEIDKGENANLSALSSEAENILTKQYGYYSKPKKDGSSESDQDSGKIKGYSEELNKAATSLFFRNHIVNQILSSGENVFKTFYFNFLDNVIKQARRRINEHSETLRRRTNDLEFNQNERKVWGMNKNAHPMSGNINDYYLKIEEEDFEDTGKERTIEQPEEMKTSKKKIENERYNFLQRLKKSYDISDKDFDKIHDLGIMSFIDRDRLLKMATTKLEKKGLSKKEIRKKIDDIIKKSSNEKEAEKKVEGLLAKSIDKEDMYSKAYRLFIGDLSRPEIKKITDGIINKSKSEKEVEDRLKRLANEREKSKESFNSLKRDILGLSDE